MKYADIILPLPLQDCFTYAVPTDMQSMLQVGCRVQVPFGQKKVYIGIVLRLHDTEPVDYKVKAVMRMVDSYPVVTPRQLELWQWAAEYYICSLGEVMNAALPAGLKDDSFRPKTETLVHLAGELHADKVNIVLNFLRRSKPQQVMFETYLEMSGFGRQHELTPVTKTDLMRMCSGAAYTFKALVDKKLLTTSEQEVGRLAYVHDELVPLSQLSEAQQVAFDQIGRSFQSHDVTLLHGVTSSGKTEVYMHLMQQVIDSGRQVLYLLPEIALTTQLTDRLRRVFGARMGVYHSKFTDSERVEVYRRQLGSQPFDIILGVRSSVFLPFRDLGLVIIDEEHEPSYKQQDPAPRYHARSMALVLARRFGAKTLLGSATPSVDTFHMARTGRYGYVSLTCRYRDLAMPQIHVVDIRRLRFQKRMRGVFSQQLLDAMGEALSRGEQVILFQNRRGYANFLQCRTCGWVPRCDRCDVSLTYHRLHGHLTCHYCGQVYQVPDACPQCEGREFTDVGMGTEKVEAEVHQHFPQARTIRMDIDTAHTRHAYEQIIGDFAARRYDVLIGTQMVSKGLDFAGVSVVGILDADTMLNIPDFRSHERTFQVVAQVSGRAGRAKQGGQVILQTRSADSDTIAQVVANDYEAMYKTESEEREAFRYPPFTRLINVYVRHRDAQRADLLAGDMARLLRAAFADRVLGPDRPAVARVKSMSVRKIVVKLEKNASPHTVRSILLDLQARLMMQPSASGVQIYYDVDPM